jgi:2-polyprenyl-3-methyl-5-hydroxy-6-metoxy-1,4-benzoquinol methylase
MVPNPLEDDLSWLHPPKNLRDASAWDQYHYQHLSHGLGPPITDMLCDDRELVTAMNALQFRTVLCAGSGLSLEPLALAAAGFRVTALDLSARALHVIGHAPPSSNYTDTFLDPQQLRPGGSVEWVAGDIMDVACCPGPFDVIIERRTAQNYPELAEILTPLIGRLSSEGVFVTHCHDGAWRPPARPRHRVGDWLKKQDWRFWDGTRTKPPGRVAWLLSTTG